ncbi:MAG: hypothetical protein ACK5I7_02215 [Anaerotignum sp.]
MAFAPVATRGLGSQKYDDWDKKGSITAYIKVEYSLSSFEGNQHVKLTKISEVIREQAVVYR